MGERNISLNAIVLSIKEMGETNRLLFSQPNRELFMLHYTVEPEAK